MTEGPLLVRDRSRAPFVLAAVILMALGVAVAAAIGERLDGAAVLPLAGAVLVLPILERRASFAMFVLAFAASMTGEVAAHLAEGMTLGGGLANDLLPMASSAAMLAFIYGLVWWVSDQSRLADARSAHALTSQRQLLALNERFLATVDPAQVLELIADSLKAVVAYDNLTIYRVDREAGVLRPVLARDRFASLILDNAFDLDHGITGWVVSHGEAQCINDAQLDPRMMLIPGTPAEAESLIVVPLMGNGMVAGTLNLGRMGDGDSHFSATEFEMARLFASQAAIALQNADLHRSVSTRAETDALTGVQNRGAFEARIAALLGDPGMQPLTLLMLDLDRFKTFNDRRGHPAGDALLGSIARGISGAVRVGDRVYRYGGDEFAVLLPSTARAVGAEVGERIRAAIAAVDEAVATSVTTSVGAASAPDDATGRDGLVAAADAALYRAKASGGDCVVLAA